MNCLVSYTFFKIKFIITIICILLLKANFPIIYGKQVKSFVIPETMLKTMMFLLTYSMYKTRLTLKHQFDLKETDTAQIKG